MKLSLHSGPRPRKREEPHRPASQLSLKKNRKTDKRREREKGCHGVGDIGALSTRKHLQGKRGWGEGGADIVYRRPQ